MVVVHKSAALALKLHVVNGSYGYDTCPMEGFDSLRVKVLKLPSNTEINMILGCGIKTQRYLLRTI